MSFLKYDNPIVTIVVPSYNQGIYLNQNLESIFLSNIPLEVFLMDAGSNDQTLDVINKWSHRINWWRSQSDNGQASAINEGIKLGTAPYVCWLNSDDYFLKDGLEILINNIELFPNAPFVYGKVLNFHQINSKFNDVKVFPFDYTKFCERCIISQPGTLIRRRNFEFLGGLNETLKMSMDYDLWWRLSSTFGNPVFIDDYVAVNRIHNETKTNNNSLLHYCESISVVLKYSKKLPLRWIFYSPLALFYRIIKNYIYNLFLK